MIIICSSLLADIDLNQLSQCTPVRVVMHKMIDPRGQSIWTGIQTWSIASTTQDSHLNSIYLSTYLSIYLSTYLSVYLPIYLNTNIYIYTYTCIYAYIVYRSTIGHMLIDMYVNDCKVNLSAFNDFQGSHQCWISFEKVDTSLPRFWVQYIDPAKLKPTSNLWIP